MVANAREPLQVPAEFWQHADVIAALDHRDIGQLFVLLRRHCGASQSRIGLTVGMTQGTVSLVINRTQVVTALTVLERIADGLTMPDQARIRLGLAPKETDMRRRTALGIGLLASISPATLTSVLRESAAEALEFTRERATTTIGRATLDHLTSVIIDLDRAYPWRPATELFPVARAYRNRVETLIDGKHTLTEARELHVHSAYLSHILADLAYDLGSNLTAKAFAIDAQQLADQAGHNELYAWATDTLTAAMDRAAQYPDTIDATQQALTRAPKQHILAIRLRTRVAKAYAAQGDDVRATDLLNEARHICDTLPPQTVSRFSTENAEHISFTLEQHTAASYVRLGKWKDAERHSRAAGGVAQWSPGRAAIAQLDLGIALTHLGHPDEAAERGKQALALGRSYGNLLERAKLLDTALQTHYPKQPGTTEFHATYKAIAATPTRS